MLFSELYEITVNKVTFIGFRVGDRSNRLPGSAPGRRQWTASTVEVFLVNELFMR